MLYPLGQEPIFGRAGRAFRPGTQYCPLVLYPDGQDPDLMIGSWAKAGMTNTKVSIFTLRIYLILAAMIPSGRFQGRGLAR